jgi:hypothetical protein
MIKKIILITLLFFVNVSIVFISIEPLYVTWAEILPKNVEYNINDKESIEKAIIHVRSNTLEEMRRFYSKPILLLSGLVGFNFLFLTIVTFANRSKRNKDII